MEYQRARKAFRSISVTKFYGIHLGVILTHPTFFKGINSLVLLQGSVCVFSLVNFEHVTEFLTFLIWMFKLMN